MSGLTETAPRIHQLPPGLVNQIAAGEVVERPASVLKELLENAVDAASTRVAVDVLQGGAELIRVVDDGHGIHPDDLELAVTSHATSKLASAEDLFRVQTMGFRGEALASIAEVSRFRIRTRPAELDTGRELEVDAGRRRPAVPCGCPAGTQVEVRDLFCNAPVRRKFLKSPSTEFAHLSEQFTRIALAAPRLHLVLRHQDRTVFDLPAADDLRERLGRLLGGDVAATMIAVDASQGDLRVWGFVGHPEEHRATRKQQYLYVNGRWIQDRSLQHALTEGYRGLLMTGRQPICCLFLETPPDQVDVNVHPTKSEVRFVDPQRLYRLVLSSIRTRFLGMNLEGGLQPEGLRSSAIAGSGADAAAAMPAPRVPNPSLFDRTPGDPAAQARAGQEFVDWARAGLASWAPRTDLSDLEARAEALDQFEAAREAAPPAAGEPRAEPLPPGWAPAPVVVGAASLAPPPDILTSPASSSSSVAADLGLAAFAAPMPAPPGASSSEPPGPGPSAGGGPAPQGATAAGTAFDGTPRAMQVLDCYLVVETTEGLTLIDQHALHERILYEQFRARVLEQKVERQRLLMPLVLEMTTREVELLSEAGDVLHELGFEAATFGGRSIALSAYPALLRRADPADLLRAVVEQLDGASRALSRRDMLDAMLHMMACKAAVKAGQRLTCEEIDALLAQRRLVDDHHHCPHGRPTALTLSRRELDRQFGRLG